MATVPTFTTFVAGAVLTAAQLNANVRDAGNFFLSTPVCELRQTAAQSIPNSSVTAINFDTEDIDTDGMHSTSTNTSRATAVTAGRYQVSGGVGFAGNATVRRQASIAGNGTSLNAVSGLFPPGSASLLRMVDQAKTTYLAVGDYLQTLGFQESGGALNTVVDADHQSGMSVRWIGTT